MKELGATVETADAWNDKAVQDGKLVTGRILRAPSLVQSSRWQLYKAHTCHKIQRFEKPSPHQSEKVVGQILDRSVQVRCGFPLVSMLKSTGCTRATERTPHIFPWNIDED